MTHQTMRTNRLAKLALAFATSATLVGCGVTGQSPTPAPKEVSVFPNPTTWQPLSTTASGITGEIILTDKQITFANQKTLALEPIEHDADTGQTLFKVTDNTNPKLLNGNLLCGLKPVDYLVVQTSGDVPGQSDMQLMAYYYPEALRLSDLPLKDLDSLERQMCALYTYVGPAMSAPKAM